VTATTPKSIVKGKTGDIYRILNSGDEDFVVAFAGPSGPSPVTVHPDFSFDFPVTADVTICGTGPSATEVEGIYELLHAGASGRSGRFKFRAATGTNQADIICGGGHSIYRVFNSGDNSFNMQLVGTAVSLELAKGESFDIGLPPTASVRIENPHGAATPVDGIYEVLDEGSEVRNGRFKLEGATNHKDHKKRIIGLSGRNDATGFYRVYNSGETIIGVYRGPLTEPVPEHLLEPSTSYDFYVGLGTGNNKIISVGGPGDPTDPSLPGPAVDIEGSYAFLGS
jgi:hypothetical protein